MNRRITYPFILAISLLAAAELVMRLFFSASLDNRFDYGYCPSAGFVEEKSGTVKLIRCGGRKFWPQSFRKVRPSGNLRIMVVGDSVTRGPDLGNSYPTRLEERLQAQGMDARCLNLGVPGYGACRKKIIFEKSLEYSPSMLILHVNDTNEYEDEREYARSQDFKGWHPKNWIMKSMLIRRLYEAKTEQVFWKLLPTDIRNQSAVNDIDAKIAASRTDKKKQEWRERVLSYTKECVSLARSRHIPVILVCQAYRKDLGGGRFGFDDHGLKALLSPMAGPGVYVVSMEDALEGSDLRAVYSGDGSHLKPSGYEILGSALARTVITAFPKQHGLTTPAGRGLIKS